MDLFNEFKSLVDESLLCKSFRELPIVKRILCIIVLSPFIALYTCMLLAYWLLATIYRCAQSVLDYVNAFVKAERDEVRHGAEVVIYAIAFPVIFAMKLVNTVIAIVLMVVHFFTTLVGFVATLGGIKFSPFILEPANRSFSKGIVKHCKAAVIVFIVIGLVLISLSLLFKFVTYEIYKAYKEYTIREVVVSEIVRAKNEKLITTQVWNEFVFDYDTYGINSKNYRDFEAKYLKGIEHKTWDVPKEAAFNEFVSATFTYVHIVYTLFTFIYVAIYAGVIKRKCDVEAEETSYPWEKSQRLEWN